MSTCKKCGAQINDESMKFCPSCGAALDEANGTEQKKEEKQDLSAKIQNLNNTKDTTSDFEKEDIENNKVMGVLAYLSWLVLIPLFAAPKSKFARFHANQGIVLAITEIIWWIITVIIANIIPILSSILGLVNILFLILAIIGIINAVNGKAKELPIVGKFRILK